VRISSKNKGDQSALTSIDEDQSEVFRVAATRNNDAFPNAAFRTPDGKIVLIVANDIFATGSFRVQYRGRYADIQLQPGAVGTYVWNVENNVR